MDKKAIIIFGAPGAGKDTQSGLLKKFFKDVQMPFLYIGTGEKFRKAKKENNYTMSLLKENMDKGELVPDCFANGFLSIDSFYKYKGGMSLILNGIPRNIEQAETVLGLINFYKLKPVVLFIKVSLKEAKKRMHSRGEGRSDDNEESIKRRFEIFNEENKLLLEYLKSYFNFIEIDGNGKPMEIHKKILTSLES
jgi:adenylate kinase